MRTIREQLHVAIARDRFVKLTGAALKQALEEQSNRAVDLILTVKSFPYIYTNAGVTAEAAAHWAFMLHPELRAEDDTFWAL